MHVLVTGATGLLGSVVCRRLVERGIQVTGIVRAESLAKSSEIRFLSLDLATEGLDRDCLAGIDVIIHLAQSSKFRDFPGNALDIYNVNVASTARLLDYAREVGISKFIYASSGGVYGHGSQAFKENAAIVPPGQLGYYLGSKACGEILVQSYASIFNVTVIRPFFIYGPGQNRSMLIPRLIDCVAAGTPINLHGSDGIRINPVHVEDAAFAVIGALDKQDNATYNIAGPEVLSMRQIGDAIGNYLCVEPVFAQIQGERRDLVADISAMKSSLHTPLRLISDSLCEISV